MIRPLSAVLSAFVLTLASAVSATAAPVAPYAQIQYTVENETFGIDANDWRSSDEGKTWLLSWKAENASSPLQFLEISADTDPFFVYSFGVINGSTGAISFSVLFTLPYVGGPYNRLTLSHTDTVQDQDKGVAVVGPVNGPAIANAGIDGALELSLGPGCAFAATPTPAACTTGSPVTTTVSSLNSGTFFASLNFIVGAKDVYNSNGRVTLDNAPVPEPASLWLLTAGVVGLVSRRRTRR